MLHFTYSSLILLYLLGYLARGTARERQKDQVMAMRAAHEYKPMYRAMRNGTLCVSFLNTMTLSSPAMRLFKENVAVSYKNRICRDWVVLSYRCDQQHVTQKVLEQIAGVRLKLFYCSPVPTNKALMYSELLPLLDEKKGAAYRRVWLLDEDIAIAPMDFVHFADVVDCAFFPREPPLVVQATVVPSTQVYPFLNHDEWQGTGVAAVHSHFVEVQMPLFDAAFFHWLTTFVISPLTPSMQELHSLWGIDEVFCRSAAFFSAQMHISSSVAATGRLDRTTSASASTTVGDISPPACAVVTAPRTAVGHYNLRTIDKATSDFKGRGFRMKSRVSRTFPKWHQQFKAGVSVRDMMQRPRFMAERCVQEEEVLAKLSQCKARRT